MLMHFAGGLRAAPTMAVRRVLPTPVSIVLGEAGEIQRSQFPEENCFCFLVQRGRKDHEEKANWSKLWKLMLNCGGVTGIFEVSVLSGDEKFTDAGLRGSQMKRIQKFEALF